MAHVVYQGSAKGRSLCLGCLPGDAAIIVDSVWPLARAERRVVTLRLGNNEGLSITVAAAHVLPGVSAGRDNAAVLLRARADINITDTSGQTALHYACESIEINRSLTKRHKRMPCAGAAGDSNGTDAYAESSRSGDS